MKRTDARGARRTLRIPHRPVLRTLAGIAGSAVLLGFLIHKVDPARLAEVLRQARPGFLALAVASSGGALALVAVRWHLMLWLRGMSGPFRHSGRTTLVGYVLTLVLPGAMFGDFGKSVDHARRHRRPLAELLLVCGLDRFAGLVGLAVYVLMVGVVAVPAASLGDLTSRWEWTLKFRWWWIPAAVAAAGAGWVALRSVRGRAGIIRAGHLARNGWDSLRERPHLLIFATGLSVLANLCVAGTLAFGLAGVAAPGLPWMRILWTLPLIGLAAAFPFTVAGAGAREGAAIVLWSACGVPALVAVAACLITLAANLSWAAVGAVLLFQAPPKPRGGHAVD